MSARTVKPMARSRRPRKIIGKQEIISILYFITAIGIAIAAWQAIIWLIDAASPIPRGLPGPWDALTSFLWLLANRVEGYTILDHVLASFARVMLGFLFAFIIAVPLGVLMASSKRIDRLLQPIVEMTRPIPPIAWIPIAIIVLGLTIQSYAFIIFIGAFFPLLQNTRDGVKQSPRIFQDIARSMGASRAQIIWEVKLPSILPNLFTGIKTAMGIGWMCVIAAELMGISTAGIGYFIVHMKNLGHYAFMVSGMVAIAATGLLINAAFKIVEKYALKWTEELKS